MVVDLAHHGAPSSITPAHLSYQPEIVGTVLEILSQTPVQSCPALLRLTALVPEHLLTHYTMICPAIAALLDEWHAPKPLKDRIHVLVFDEQCNHVAIELPW